MVPVWGSYLSADNVFGSVSVNDLLLMFVAECVAVSDLLMVLVAASRAVSCLLIMFVTRLHV